MGFAVAQLCSLTVTNSGQRADARDSEEAWLEFRERGTAHRIYVHSLASDWEVEKVYVMDMVLDDW